MKSRPILFSGPMVRAILDGKKTQTRRPCRCQDPSRWRWNGSRWELHQGYPLGHDTPVCPFGTPGDRLIPAILLRGYDVRYCADINGRIWSKSTGEWKALAAPTTSGYMRVCLRMEGREVNRLVHRLVCEAYHGPPNSARAVVRHLDGSRENNQPDNLDWGSYSDNWEDRKHHRRGINEEHHNAKITMETARIMRRSGRGAPALAKEYGLSSKTVSRILNGETWVEGFPELPPNCPRWASRITLEITDVRVERLKELSDEDAEAEGFEDYFPSCREWDDLQDGFQEMWDSIYGKKHPWASSPWVWVVTFRRTTS